MSPFSFEEARPDPALCRLVHRAWRASTREAIDDFLIVPDGCVDILYSADEGLQVVGAMTAALSLSLPAGTEVVGLRLHPGAAAPWLRIDLAELTDGQVPLGDVLGARVGALEDLLRSIGNPRHRAMALCREVAGSLSSCWSEATPRELAFQRALAALARVDGEVTVEWLALQCNLGTRQFQRRCLAATGLPPKLLARVFRLMRVLRQRQHTGSSWTHVAADCGYADQAHFIHDFTDLVGCSPGAYARRQGDVRFSQVDGAHSPIESCHA
jgi:AraC-like DNA-binding protein